MNDNTLYMCMLPYFSLFRAIFLWLCSKDLTKLNFDNVQKGSPEEILLNLKESKTTYAVVYETLCRSVDDVRRGV